MHGSAAELLGLSFCFSLNKSCYYFFFLNLKHLQECNTKTIMYLKCVQVMELLTLCCGARWISCCWSSSLLQLLSTSSVGPPSFTHSSAESAQLFLHLLLLNLLPSSITGLLLEVGTPQSLRAYLCCGGMLVCWLPAALVSCCLFSFAIQTCHRSPD